MDITSTVGADSFSHDGTTYRPLPGTAVFVVPQDLGEDMVRFPWWRGAQAEDYPEETPPVVGLEASPPQVVHIPIEDTAPVPEPHVAPEDDPPADTRPARLDTTAVREWARANGYTVADRGAIPAKVRDAYLQVHQQ